VIQAEENGMKARWLIVLFLIGAWSIAWPARAQLLLTLDTPDQMGPVGTILTYTGQLTNLAADPLSIEGLAFNFIPPAPGFDAFESSELADFLALGGNLDPAQSFSGPLFHVAIDPSVPVGTVATGDFTVNGSLTDPEGNQTEVFASTSFSATATAGTGGGTEVPEPALAVLGGSAGLALALVATRRKRRRERLTPLHPPASRGRECVPSP
jgi:hypothetical protein